MRRRWFKERQQVKRINLPWWAVADSQHRPVAWRGGAAGAAAATLCQRGDGRQGRHSIGPSRMLLGRRGCCGDDNAAVTTVIQCGGSGGEKVQLAWSGRTQNAEIAEFSWKFSHLGTAELAS